MRSYQTLTVVGVVLSLLIAYVVYGIIGGLATFHNGFTDFTHKYSNSTQIQQFESDKTKMDNAMKQIGLQLGVVTVAGIIGMVIVFAMKQTKVVGIVLIIVSLTVLIGTGLFGIIGFALLLAGGVAALRYKSKVGITA